MGSFDEAALIALRRQIHAHPELSRQEFQTSQLILQYLAEAGLSPRLMSQGTGVVCEIGSTGPMLAIRADLDALPIDDTTDTDYRSQIPNVSHACGHDVHTTILVGTALSMASTPPRSGRLRFIFQPAEEAAPSGSLDAIKDGVLEEVKVIYALHCDPTAPVGKIGTRIGPLTSAYDRIKVVVHNPNLSEPNHQHKRGRRPDLIYILAKIITELPLDIRARQGNGAKETVVFGTFNSIGETDDPDRVEATGTIRCPDIESWHKLPELVEQFVTSTIEPYGIKCELEYERVCPIVDNDVAATTVVSRAVAQEFGEEALYEPPQSSGGEDFAWYTREVPGTLVRLGTRGAATPQVDLHSASFDVDEEAISVGVRLWNTVIREQLRQFAEERSP